MNVFVSGGSGFIGQHLVRALVARGDRVRAMARSDASAAIVNALGAQPVRCDLETVAESHLDGCDVAIHAAAFVEPYGTREAFERINVGGTQRMLDAARGCARFVHVGTEAVLFCGDPLVNVDETHPYPARHRYLYSETKAEAERRVLGTSGLAALSIRPRFVWGPGDTTILPQIQEAADAGAWLWMDGGQSLTSTTHVANLVDALLRATERGEGGEAYFVADEGTRTMRAFVTALARSRGLTLPERNVPGWLGRGFAHVVERTWTLARRRTPPPITRLGAAMMSTTVTVDTTKARRELGWSPPITVEQGMAELALG